MVGFDQALKWGRAFEVWTPKGSKVAAGGQEAREKSGRELFWEVPENVCSLVSLSDSRGRKSCQVQLCSCGPLLDVPLQSAAQRLE